jgi:hypothetical protein
LKINALPNKLAYLHALRHLEQDARVLMFISDADYIYGREGAPTVFYNNVCFGNGLPSSER